MTHKTWIALLILLGSLASPSFADILISTNSPWRYFKGATEASSPTNAWRDVAFDDSAWALGAAPFHYGTNVVGGDDTEADGTILSDMPGNYTCVYLRRTFVIQTNALRGLTLGFYIDDGLAVWINGKLIRAAGVRNGSFAHTDSAFARREANLFYTYDIYSTAADALRDGTNVLCVQAFNYALGDDDFRVAVELFGDFPDITGPVISQVLPPAGGTVHNLNSITVQFSEPVAGVGFSDLLVNGVSASAVTGSGTTYTFTVEPPPPGPVAVSWDVETQITDLSPEQNLFDPRGPTATWQYTFVDTTPPVVLSLNPPDGVTVGQLTQITVRFNESVTGVDAADLLVNGVPASGVSGSQAGPYGFTFTAPDPGTVQVAWAAGHGIQDTAAAPNAFAGGSWSYTLDPSFQTPEVRVNELLASASSGTQLKDEDGELQDWIELYNAGNTPVNLLGWSLTDDPDDPDRWIFPNVTLGARQYLVVFASGKDRRSTAPGAKLHTNFKLTSFGEFLGLYTADSPRVPAWTMDVPEQRADYSYGYDPADQLRYFANPTPGGPNGNSTVTGLIPPVHFSVEHGLFDAPFTLVLTVPVPGSTIRYTTDGTPPTATTGQVYSGPLPVTTTTTLSAAAYKTGFLPSRVATRTYIFPEQVLHQPNNPSGFPSNWGSWSSADYEMDPEIVNHPSYRDQLKPALAWLPSLSIVMKQGDVFGSSGIYANPTSRGSNWEKPCSLELIFPDGREGFQVNCGIQMQGNANRNPNNSPKHAFRVVFKGQYGPKKLEYPLYPDSPVTRFNTLVLRADYNNSWIHWSPSQRLRGQRTRDAFIKDCLRDMGGLASHNRYVHLYINGLYWGIYDPTERPDDEFAASYLGGEPEEYDVLNEGGVKAGNKNAYNTMLGISNLSDNAQYEQMQQYLDIPQFIDYMLVHFYAANHDWGNNKNWYAVRRRAPGEGFKYVPWDGERILESATANEVSPTDVPSGLHTKLDDNAEYRLRFADHVHRHFFNGGALTPEAVIARWRKRAQEVDLGMIAESARWGDYRRDVHVRGTAYLYTYNDHFLVEQNRLLNQYFPVRTANVLNQLRAQGLYPDVPAPEFNQHGGRVPAGFSLTLTGGGTTYYTTDGSDPRVYGTGAVSPAARAYSGPIALNRTTLVKARTLNGGTWSALTEATFTVAQLGLPLRITEIMYNPFGGDPYEFIELQNTGDVPVEVGGFAFSGITFGFTPGTVLAPSQVVLLANGTSPAAFASRYPGATVFGYFAGNLANGGERIALLDASGRTVTAVIYNDKNGWPEAADGYGASLELNDPRGPLSDPANWRASAQPNGTPGTVLPSPSLGPVRLNEIMAENLSTITNGGALSDWIELHNSGASPVSLANWSLSDGGNPRRFVFPADTTIPAGGYLLVWGDSQTNAPGLHTGFGLKREGESVFLYDASVRRVDAVSFGPQLPDRTVGRISGVWQLCQPTPGAANALAPVAPGSNLMLNEWLADSVPGDDDWIELFNRHATLPAALQGVYLGTSNATFQLASLAFIPPHGYVRLWADEQAGADHLDFKLPAAGGTLVLYDPTGQELDRINYSAQTEGVSEGRLPDGASALRSFPGTASPGASNYLSAYTGPVLNEVMARNRSAVVGPHGQYPDWLELVNPNDAPFDLSGLRLSDERGDNDRWVVPDGAQIPAQGHLVVWCDGTRPGSTVADASLNTGFSLAGDGGGVYLFNAAGQVVDAVEYGPQVADLPIGMTAGQWQLLSAPTPGAANAAAALLGPATALRLNEWMAEPVAGEDWFELFNTDARPVALNGLYLTDDPSIAGRAKSPIGPLSFIGGHAWVQFEAGGQLRPLSPQANFNLDPAGETLRLYAADFTVIDSVAFGWQSPGVSQGRLPDGGGAIVSFAETASPGTGNYLPLNVVVINEVLAHTDPPLEDAIELHNPGPTPVSLGGWYLSDAAGDPKQYRIPPGTTIPADGFMVFYEAQFNPDGDGPLGFALSGARGGTVYLWQADLAGNLTGYRAAATFGASPNGVSLGRYPTSAGVDFVALDQRTFGADDPASLTEFRSGTGLPNAPARVGPVVISEIMYHPFNESAGGELAEEEFIELSNRSSNPVLLYDPAHPTNHWRLAQAIEFVFPAGSQLDPGQPAVVVAFDPQLNPAALARFRARYGLSETATVFGPWSGRLGNAGEDIELLRPDTPQSGAPDTGYVPYLLEERVQYRDTTPWPAAADGTGFSLQRLNLAGYGNEPTNWTAAAPNPGPPVAADTDGDGMPDDWESAHHLNPAADDALDDYDGDGLSNLDEYRAGTLPDNAQSNLRLEITQTGSVTLRFGAVAGKSYVIEYTEALPGGGWTTWTNVPARPFDRTEQFADPGGAGDRFYRVRSPF